MSGPVLVMVAVASGLASLGVLLAVLLALTAPGRHR